MVAGAKSVASYLENDSSDVLLAALPLSFDAGFSQLTTGFHAGASVVLLNYVLPKDVVKAVAVHGVTGLTAVPPLWIQLAQLEWPIAAQQCLRYFTNSGALLLPVYPRRKHEGDEAFLLRPGRQDMGRIRLL